MSTGYRDSDMVRGIIRRSELKELKEAIYASGMTHLMALALVRWHGSYPFSVGKPFMASCLVSDGGGTLG
jgi:hypothetical protein